MEYWFIYSWSILPTIYIAQNCIVNLVWHILHRWLEIVVPPVTFKWFLRYLKPRNYITIIINTKSLKIFPAHHVDTACVYILTNNTLQSCMDIQNIIINTVEIILKYVNILWVTPLLWILIWVPCSWFSIPILCRGIARLNLILFRAYFL